MLILQRLYTMPATSNGRIIHGIQVAVLTLALLNTAGLYLLTYSDGAERYDLMVQKYQRVSTYAGFMLIQIPAAYLLSVMMRYVLRAQSSTVWSVATANAEELQERASDGMRAASQALSEAPSKAMASLGEVLAGSGNAKDLATSVMALADALKLLDDKVDLRAAAHVRGGRRGLRQRQRLTTINHSVLYAMYDHLHLIIQLVMQLYCISVFPLDASKVSVVRRRVGHFDHCAGTVAKGDGRRAPPVVQAAHVPECVRRLRE